MMFAADTVTFIALKPRLLTGKARRVMTTWGWANGSIGKRRYLIELLSAELLPRWLPMTGEAALRCGTRLVRVLTREENIPLLFTARPELMVAPLTRDTLQQGLEWADVVVIGQGLGQVKLGKKCAARGETF